MGSQRMGSMVVSRERMRTDPIPESLHVLVFDLREVVEDGAALWIRLDARERAIEPRGVHLVGVVLGPGWLDRHVRDATGR